MLWEAHQPIQSNSQIRAGYSCASPNHPFTCVPACNLSVYASQWLLPDTTQDSIHSCLAQALPWPPFQTAELNALARRNSHRTGLKPLDLSGSCHPLKAAAFRRDHWVPPVAR